MIWQSAILRAAVAKLQLHEHKLYPVNMNNPLTLLFIVLTLLVIQWIKDHGCIGVSCGLSIVREFLSPVDTFSTDWRQMPTASDALQMGGLIWRGIVAWNKGLGARAPHKGYFRHQCEYIVWGTNGKCPKAKHAGPYPGCFNFPVKQKDKFHLT